MNRALSITFNKQIIKINNVKPNYFSWPKSMRILLISITDFLCKFCEMMVFILKKIVIWLV